MKIKYATDVPGNTAYVILATNGVKHQKYMTERAHLLVDEKGDSDPSAIYKTEYFDAVMNEVLLFKKSTSPEKAVEIKLKDTPNGLRYNDAKWLNIQDKFIDFALMYRLKHDSLFANVIKFIVHKQYKFEYVLPVIPKKSNKSNMIQNTVIGTLDKHIGDQLMIYANML
jgi:hypothetical protein